MKPQAYFSLFTFSYSLALISLPLIVRVQGEVKSHKHLSQTTKKEQAMDKEKISTKHPPLHHQAPWKKILLALCAGLGLLSIGAYTYNTKKEEKEQTPFKHYTDMINARDIDFTQDRALDFTSERPMIRTLSWINKGTAKLTYQKVVNGTLQIIHKDEDKKKQRADEIFYPTHTQHWDWRPKNKPWDLHHNPGYQEKIILDLTKRVPDITHIIYSTGWDDILLFQKKKRNTLNNDDIKALQTLIKNHLKVKKVHVVQSLNTETDPREAFKAKQGEVTILILDTPKAAIAYNYLVQNKENRVVASLHTTC